MHVKVKFGQGKIFIETQASTDSLFYPSYDSKNEAHPVLPALFLK